MCKRTRLFHSSQLPIMPQSESHSGTTTTAASQTEKNTHLIFTFQNINFVSLLAFHIYFIFSSRTEICICFVRFARAHGVSVVFFVENQMIFAGENKRKKMCSCSIIESAHVTTAFILWKIICLPDGGGNARRGFPRHHFRDKNIS